VLAEAIEKWGRLIKFAGIKGKTIQRDYIKATVGFEKLGEATDTPPKSLISHVWPAWQSAGQEPVQRDRLPAETLGCAAAREWLVGT
jgi:hypothetical protein